MAQSPSARLWKPRSSCSAARAGTTLSAKPDAKFGTQAVTLAASDAYCYNGRVVTNERISVPSREQLVHLLYEAAELEHTLMCCYLYAAFSLRNGEAEGLSPEEAASVAEFRRVIIKVAVEEMGHLTAVWNITAALGGAPRFGRGNFPLEPGTLPAGIVVKLAPFGEDVIQHFIFLERPANSSEPEGNGFAPERLFGAAWTAFA